MSEHLSAQIIEQYRRRVVSPDELLSVGDHLATCEDCRRRASEAINDDLSKLPMQFQKGLAEFESEHLSYDQIAALVDNEIGETERETLESHLDICALCSEEFNDLRAFRPEAIAASVRVPETTTRTSRWQKIEAFTRTLLPQRAVLTAAFALLLLSVSVVLFFAWRAKRPSESSQQTTVNTSPEVQSNANSQSIPQPSEPQRQPTNDSQIVVAMNDGGEQITLDSRGNFVGLESLSPSSRQAVKQALTTERVEVPTGMSELSGTKGTLLGPDQSATFSVLSPVGTIVRTQRPTFRWARLSGASSYRVSVLDADFNEVVTSPQLSTTSWTPSQALERSRVFSWQVTAVKDGQEIISPSASAAEARFKVLDQAKAGELRVIEKAGVASHLARGTLYARAGLLDDAERELRALVIDNPESPTARKLLQSIQAIRKR